MREHSGDYPNLAMIVASADTPLAKLCHIGGELWSQPRTQAAAAQAIVRACPTRPGPPPLRFPATAAPTGILTAAICTAWGQICASGSVMRLLHRLTIRPALRRGWDSRREMGRKWGRNREVCWHDCLNSLTHLMRLSFNHFGQSDYSFPLMESILHQEPQVIYGNPSSNTS